MTIVKQFMENAKKLNVNIDSIVVEQDGIVEEQVINNIELHELRSCGKLLIAMAYGIAINDNMKCKKSLEGLSLSTKIYPTISKLVDGIPSPVKEWTIRTLLTHSTGYEKMLMNRAQVQALDKYKLLDTIMEIPLKYPTDTHFTYNNVEPYILSIFFKENFDIDISDYIGEKIFRPMGIKNFRWDKYGKYCAGATGLFLNYKDFHKIGKLLLNYGQYEGKQIVPEHWMREMTKVQVHCPDYYKPERVLPKLDAGYFTWISKNGIVFRDGSNGQYIICDYPHNMVITIMATQKDMSLVTECLRGLIAQNSPNVLVLAYPGSGKTYLADNYNNVCDLEFQHYRWDYGENDNLPMEQLKGCEIKFVKPEWPENFFKLLKEKTAKPQVVLVPMATSLFPILDQLASSGVRVIFAIRDKDCVDEMVDIYRKRGNKEKFITDRKNDFQKFHDLTANCKFERAYIHKGEYLYDALARLGITFEKGKGYKNYY